MERKITERKFINTLVNNEDILTAEELASQLGISRGYFFKLKKRFREQIAEASRELCLVIAIKQVRYLDRNASKGDTRASQIILEIAGVYQPKAKLDVEGNITITVTERYIEGAKALAKELVTGVTQGDGSIVDEGEWAMEEAHRESEPD